MHPDIMRELMNQRAAEIRTNAREARFSRAARKLARARRDLAKISREFSAQEIPDSVDEMFGEAGAGAGTGQASCRRAA